jgi:hypothetical protein
VTAGAASHGVGCYVSETVQVGGDLYGTLCFADGGPRPAAFTEAKRLLVTLLADHVGYPLGAVRRSGRRARDPLAGALTGSPAGRRAATGASEDGSPV